MSEHLESTVCKCGKFANSLNTCKKYSNKKERYNLGNWREERETERKEALQTLEKIQTDVKSNEELKQKIKENPEKVLTEYGIASDFASIIVTEEKIGRGLAGRDTFINNSQNINVCVVTSLTSKCYITIIP